MYTDGEAALKAIVNAELSIYISVQYADGSPLWKIEYRMQLELKLK